MIEDISSQTKPKFRKSTNEEAAERLDQMIEILGNVPGVTRYKLHRQLCTKWGCHWRTVDRYFVRARAEMLKRLKRNKESFRSELLGHYKTVLDSGKASLRDKHDAAKAVREMLGLDEPQKLQVDNRETVVVKHAHELEYSRQ